MNDLDFIRAVLGIADFARKEVASRDFDPRTAAERARQQLSLLLAEHEATRPKPVCGSFLPNLPEFAAGGAR